MQLDVMKFDNIFAGDIDVVTEPITIAINQTIQRGDVLIKTNGEYGRPAGAVIATDSVVIASEDITTDGVSTKESIGYRTGWFNEYEMRFGGASTADDNRDILADKNIYLAKAQKQ